MMVRVSITVAGRGQVDPERVEQVADQLARTRFPRAPRGPTRRARSRRPRRRRWTRIWRRLAPSVRSIANSRVRWATVIEKVLKIRNAATNSATPAKISRAVLRKPMNSPMSSCWDWTFSAPVSTSSVVRQRGLQVRREALGSRALVGGDRDLIELALLAGDPLRLGQREHGERCAAERVDVAERRDADQGVGAGPASAGDLDLVADLESLVVGRRLVDHDLARRSAAGRPRRR